MLVRLVTFAIDSHRIGGRNFGTEISRVDFAQLEVGLAI
jgi:hypothetical protein